jgi:hypothetical protein
MRDPGRMAKIYLDRHANTKFPGKTILTEYFLTNTPIVRYVFYFTHRCDLLKDIEE